MMADPAIYTIEIKSMDDLDLILPCNDGSSYVNVHMTLISDKEAKEELGRSIFEGELKQPLRVRERAIFKVNGCYYKAHCLARR